MNPHFDLEPQFLQLYEACRTETMTSIERMYALYKAVEHVVRVGIEGDFAECGVWRGGSAMMMALAARRFGDAGRRIWLYDTFAGMTPPSPRDVQSATGRCAADILAASPRDEGDPFWGIAPRAVVEENLARTSHPPEGWKIVEGDVLETLPGNAPESLAILRLDTDWHDSTDHELRTLYPRLVRGGILIVDDYGYWSGAREAVDLYFEEAGARPLLSRIDCTGRIAVKP
ncbi:MAG: O-methyltransferase [Sphingomonadales bacterium]|jgi:predicted O-methyltransferase YrrM|nr:O-methyltransferase [Sphingomonadales bacterium]